MTAKKSIKEEIERTKENAHDMKLFDEKEEQWMKAFIQKMMVSTIKVFVLGFLCGIGLMVGLALIGLGVLLTP
jgi:hypothetical protein